MNIRSDLGWEKYLKPFLYKRLPDGTGWSAVLGTMCALTFMLLVVTGMILAFYYVPSPDKAWDSVQYISNEVPLGNIVRGVVHIGLRNADARAAVFDAVVTDLLDVLPGGGLLEEGMVNVLENFLNVHDIFPFCR